MSEAMTKAEPVKALEGLPDDALVYVECGPGEGYLRCVPEKVDHEGDIVLAVEAL